MLLRHSRVTLRVATREFGTTRRNVRFVSSSSAASAFDPLDTFVRRHIGPRDDDIKAMLSKVSTSKSNDVAPESLDALMAHIVPPAIRLNRPLKIGEGKPLRGEHELLAEFKTMSRKNKIFRSFLGQGYSGTVVPPVIQRNILENPGWYTPYTPYQAEIAQGRLESLLNFQTMITDMTGLPVANASLLDEATAAAEAMALAFALSNKGGAKTDLTFLVDKNCHPSNIDTVKLRAEPLGLKVHVVDLLDHDFSKSNVCGILVQYPGTDGKINDYEALATRAHAASAIVIAACDLLSLAMLRPPGEWGADIALGNSQRFGVPLGYGGPHAAFFASADKFKRMLPGRIIGVSKDVNGGPALRMSLQTREQHIRREKATSNICTAQALLANMAAMYSVYHGPQGIYDIAHTVHTKTNVLRSGLAKLGFNVHEKDQFFDTIRVTLKSEAEANTVVAALVAKEINIRPLSKTDVTISLDETVSESDIVALWEGFASTVKRKVDFSPKRVEKELAGKPVIAGAHVRKSKFLTHPIFNQYHSEHELLRYIHRLQKKDLGLTTSMIPLGSCTMKLNATAEMFPVSWPEFGNLHPLVPTDQAQGYTEMFKYLETTLAEITGFSAVSLQPNAGSQGEYAGLMVIRAYHRSRNESHRNVCLIPVSAHGTNPASAVMSGMKVVAVACDDAGNVLVSDLREKAKLHRDNLAALMITYPSTHGVFEEGVKEICQVIHENGGQVYMDGANMNAQVGLCRPGDIGADCVHLNLHKTFTIPHGGGGPGMGPIGVAAHLAQFLPGHSVTPNVGGQKAIGAVSAAPWGSASILPITYVYLQLMSGGGLKKATEVAILNANYMAARLKDHYKVLFTGAHGLVAHEFIIDIRPFKETSGVEAEDIAKRLMDYGFHSPTMSFPVANTLMIEPTESESKEELDRLTDALIAIRGEIKEIESGTADRANNVLKHAPHTEKIVIADKWDRPYSREKAAFPTQWTRNSKFWPTVSRVDNVHGDRNLICTCVPMEDYK